LQDQGGAGLAGEAASAANAVGIRSSDDHPSAEAS